LDAAAAYRAMVEENAVRDALSPWEEGRALHIAVAQGFHPGVEAAADALHPGKSRQKRARLRAVARLVAELDGLLAAPERLTQAQLLRLADAWRGGYDEAIRAALEVAAGAPHEVQWASLAALLAEHAEEAVKPLRPRPRPGRPRRVLRPSPGLIIRRERTRMGYVLHFAGREASSHLLDEVLDEIERLYLPGWSGAAGPRPKKMVTKKIILYQCSKPPSSSGRFPGRRASRPAAC
ncbi:MAG: hypothetical protein ACFCUS_13505, partial [Rubrimonas sp.]